MSIDWKDVTMVVIGAIIATVLYKIIVAPLLAKVGFWEAFDLEGE